MHGDLDSDPRELEETEEGRHLCETARKHDEMKVDVLAWIRIGRKAG